MAISRCCLNRKRARPMLRMCGSVATNDNVHAEDSLRCSKRPLSDLKLAQSCRSLLLEELLSLLSVTPVFFNTIKQTIT